MNADQTRHLVQRVLEMVPAERIERNLALMAAAPLFDLELASACNIECRFCPREKMQRHDALMSDETFEAVLRFLPEDAVVMLSGLGDALVHPKLRERVTRLTARGHSFCVITNGVRLTPAVQDALIEAGIAQVQVSVHGLDCESLQGVVTRGARPDLVVSHLRRLAHARPSNLRVRLNFVETTDNSDQLQQVAEFASELGFEFFYRREHARGALSGISEDGRRGCGIFASVTFISSDGLILPCVNDVGGCHALGSVGEVSWSEVRSRKIERVREDSWFTTCGKCDDDYRWVLIGQGSLDEEPRRTD